MPITILFQDRIRNNILNTVTGAEFKEPRLHSITCKMCGSGDVWRADSQKNIFSRIWHRGLKPFQCGACKHRFYRHARRRADWSDPVNEKHSLATNTRTRVAVSTTVTLLVVALLIAGPQWRQFLRHQARGSSSILLVNAPNRSSKPFRVTPESAYVPNDETPVRSTRVETMTNQYLIELKKAGLDDSSIMLKIISAQGAFKLAAPDIIELRRAGFGDTVILAMERAMKPE